MRVAQALDEEDCAHLEALQTEQRQRKQSIKTQVEE
jgi:hypothetical protein